MRSRLRLLLFGDPTAWVPQHMTRLRAVANVRCIPRTTARQVPLNIAKAISEHGNFDGFAVSGNACALTKDYLEQ